MKRRLTMFLACFFLMLGGVMAQTKVSGVVVTYEDSEPVIGASVQVAGTQVGTVTDVNGRFELTAPAGSKTLRITYVGMEALEVAVSPKPLRIQLRNDLNDLDEVVVVAYGTQKKTSLTGSIQEVKSEAIEIRPVSSVTSALEGNVGGVQVNSTYGAPGSDPDIRIRGIGTVNGSSSPLYIMDGVPYGGNISDLNPADIESISVLKDAASAALYGNRASNGVILITTKKGKQGKMNVSLDIKQGTYSRGIPEYDRLGVNDWMHMQWEQLKNLRMSNGVSLDDAKAYATENLIADNLYLNIFNKADNALFDANGYIKADAQIKGSFAEDLDWYDQAIRHGYRQEYNISANGANDKVDYLVSLGYLDEDGYLTNSGFDRISARVSVNVQPKKWIKMGINLNGSHQNKNNAGADPDDDASHYTNPFNYARNMSPIYPVHLHDMNTGEYILDANGQRQYDGGRYTDANGITHLTRNQNPDRHLIWENELNSDKTVRNTLNGTAYVDFMLPYNFTLTLKGNLNVRNTSEQTYYNSVIGDGAGEQGRAKRNDYRYKNYTFQQQLHWSHEYGVHSVDALIGHENYAYDYNYLYGFKNTEVFAGYSYMRNFTNITDLYDYNNHYNTESYLGRVRYGYDNRYNAEVSFRRDGSSRFSKDARWGNFWSIGANWVISNEQFMKKYDWVNYLKLRADYGEVGNDAGAGYYGYMALYASTQHANQGAYWISNLPNEDLKWETSQSWGIGLDGRLFNRLNFSIEYFDKRNKDLLFNVYNPLSAGATSTSAASSTVTKNIGTISNYGWEISADIDVYKTRDWKINLGTTMTFLRNEVVKLPEQNKEGIVSGSHKIMEGKDRYAWYVYTWEGINTANGYSLYKFNDEDYYLTEDANGQAINSEGVEDKTAANMKHIVYIDGVPYSYTTNYAKREFNGTSIPKMFGSFNFNVAWKGLSLYALFTYQFGGKVLDSVYSGLMAASAKPYALHEDVLNSWTYEQRTYTLDENGNEIPLNAIDPNGTPVFNSGATVNGDVTPSLYTTSSRHLISSNYLALKNISLSYQLPKKLVRKIDLESVGITASFENLFILTKRTGLSPQQYFSGGQANGYVTPRVFSVGLNVKF